MTPENEVERLLALQDQLDAWRAKSRREEVNADASDDGEPLAGDVR